MINYSIEVILKNADVKKSYIVNEYEIETNKFSFLNLEDFCRCL